MGAVRWIANYYGSEKQLLLFHYYFQLNTNKAMAVPLKLDFEIFSAVFSWGYTGQVQTEKHWNFDKGLR